MALGKLHPNGLGVSLGASESMTGRYQTSGQVWYVDPANANALDAVGVGQDINRPLETVAQAISNAAAYDTIVIRSTPADAGAVTVNKALAFYGGSMSGGLPSTWIDLDGANFWSVTAADVEINNLAFRTQQAYIDGGGSAFGSAYITVTGARFRSRDLYLLQNHGGLTGIRFNSGGDYADLGPGTRVHLQTGVNASAIMIGAAVTGLRGRGITLSQVDGISHSGPAFDGALFTVTGMRVVEASLINGCDASFHTNTTGTFHLSTSSAGAKVVT